MDQFLKRQIEWVRTPHEGLLQIATEAGLSEDQFNACESDQQTLEDIASIRDRAKQLGVRGVPTFFVNGQMVEGDPGFKALKKRLDGLLETAAKTN